MSEILGRRVHGVSNDINVGKRCGREGSPIFEMERIRVGPGKGS